MLFRSVKTRGPLSYDAWVEGIRGGRTFISNGPLLEFSVNGVEAGSVVALAPGKARLRVRARAVSQEPYEVLEILVNGKVVKSVKPGTAAGEAVVDEAVEVERGGWIAARAHGRAMLPYGATWWMMPVFAHTSPVYLEMAGRPADARESAGVLLEQLGYLDRWAAGRARFPTAGNKREAMAMMALARGKYEGLMRAAQK